MSSFLQCAEDSCRAKQETKGVDLRCSQCGGLLEVRYHFGPIDAERTRELWLDRRRSNHPIDRSGVWRFRELVEFIESPTQIVSLSEGRTPLLDAPRTGRWAGGVRLSVKHQGNNPTGSFKDLGMTAAITRAAALG